MRRFGRFIKRALEKLDKMDLEKIRSIVRDISSDNELLEMVLDSMTDGVIVLDKENRILLFNKSSERLIPFFSDNLVEKCLWDVVDDNEISEFIRETLETQDTAQDREFALEDGSGRIIACSIMPLVRAGSIQGSLMHLEDVTEKRAKESRLRRAESLAALTTLTAGVAHEIKNPLASIGIHIQLMQKEMKGKRVIPTKKYLKYLDILNEEVDRLNMTVVDFLFAVRPMDTKLISMNINQVIKELTDFMKFELAEANVELVLDLGDLPEIDLDEKYLKQALLNLIKNSLDAMPNGGRLSITTKTNNARVYLEIADTGQGIDEENLSKIFEPYFTTKDFSSGLGLTLVFKIVKEHRGEISVKSKEGEGVVFTLSFPVAPREKRLIGFKGETA